MHDSNVGRDTIATTSMDDVAANEIFGVDALPFAFAFHVDLLEERKDVTRGDKTTMKGETVLDGR